MPPMGKKGFLYTFFIVLMIGLLTINFQIQHRSNTVLDRTNLLVAQMEGTNALVEDLLLDFDRGVGVAAVQAFKGASEFAAQNESYLDDVHVRIPELMLNGTVKGTELNASKDSTLTLWTQAVANVSDDLGMNLSFGEISILLKEAGPWQVNITAEMNVSMRDLTAAVAWNFTYLTSYLLNITDHNFTDPIYLIEGRANYESNTGSAPAEDMMSVFTRNTYTNWWQNDTSQPPPQQVNTSLLQSHVRTYRYRNDTDAPSFLQRFAGNFSASKNGIESFTNMYASPYSPDYSVNPSFFCSTDFQFFRSGCTTRHQIINTHPQFYVDDAHLISYNLTKINSS